MITKEKIENIAMLAKLSLTEDEYPALASDLQQMKEFADTIKSADVSGNTADIICDEEDFGREDCTKDSFPRDEILANAPLSDGEFFLVRKRA